MLNTIKQLLDWIYRRNCYFCRKPSSSGLMCKNCFDDVELNFPEPIKEINGVKIYSTSLYADNIKKLIRGLKYHRQRELAVFMAQILYLFWQKTDLYEKKFEIVPVPLYYSRQKERGYNHTTLIAKEFAKLTGYSVNENIVKRIKNTKPQYKLSKIERLENLKDAFEVRIEEYHGGKLLLMDDICTTGVTLEELIKTFRENNITDLCAIVAANP